MAIAIVATLVTADLVTTAAPQGAAPSNDKIVVIDVARVLAISRAGVAAREQLEREKAAMQKEIAARQKELTALNDELKKKGPLMTAEARSQKEDMFDRKRRDAERIVDDFRTELERRERGLLQKVLQDISGIINRLGKDRKYYLIVEMRRAAVVYTSPESDITEDVLKAYDLEWAKGPKP